MPNLLDDMKGKIGPVPIPIAALGLVVGVFGVAWYKRTHAGAPVDTAVPPVKPVKPVRPIRRERPPRHVEHEIIIPPPPEGWPVDQPWPPIGDWKRETEFTHTEAFDLVPGDEDGSRLPFSRSLDATGFHFAPLDPKTRRRGGQLVGFS